MRTVLAIAEKGTAFDLEPFLILLNNSKRKDYKALACKLDRVRKLWLSMAELATCTRILSILRDPMRNFDGSLENHDSVLFASLLNYSIIAYTNATKPDPKSKTGISVKMSEKDKSFQKQLHRLRNAVFAHMDRNPGELGSKFAQDRLILLHSGFGAAIIKVATRRGFGTSEFLEHMHAHILQVFDLMTGLYVKANNEISLELKYITLKDPRLGNALEQCPFNALEFFGDDKLAQIFLMNTEHENMDYLSKIFTKV